MKAHFDQGRIAESPSLPEEDLQLVLTAESERDERLLMKLAGVSQVQFSLGPVRVQTEPYRLTFGWSPRSSVKEYSYLLHHIDDLLAQGHRIRYHRLWRRLRAFLLSIHDIVSGTTSESEVLEAGYSPPPERLTIEPVHTPAAPAPPCCPYCPCPKRRADV